MSKLPGKTVYSGRRRPTTRKSGFSSSPNTTGGEWKTENTDNVHVRKEYQLEFQFNIPKHVKGSWIGFGGWFCVSDNIEIVISHPFNKSMLTPPCKTHWSKFGSAWKGDGNACIATFTIKALENCDLSVWEFECGIIQNPGCHTGETFVECTMPTYLEKIYDLSPEAHFWHIEGHVTCRYTNFNDEVQYLPNGIPITLKSCNRCARFLPINHGGEAGIDERLTLSFSNHCVAIRPCIHTGFGKLKNVDTGETLQLEYGFQLECRYCKKYCVNAAHNEKRTAAQMKEDGARRRFFELLISELYQESKQLAYKHRTGRELAEFVWENFSKKCFNCNEPLYLAREMHLDHTRPLALLWPLDETATALCGTCNSSKSDKFPSDFYKSLEKLEQLSKLTGIPFEQLLAPTPNVEVIDKLLRNLDWLFNVFLVKAEMTKERDGKVTAELVIKALQKTLSYYPKGAPVNLAEEYKKRQGNNLN